MNLWKSIKRLFFVVEAKTDEAVSDIEVNESIAVSKLTLKNATDELRKHRQALGAYDGLRVTLEQDVDRETDELAELEQQLEEYATLIELGGEGADDARQLAASTLQEIEETKEDLADLNARLDDANDGYDAMFAEIQAIEEFLENEKDDLKDDEQKLAHSRASKELALLRSQIGGEGSAIQRLSDAREKRRTLINRNTGEARTIRKLNQDGKAQLKKRVQERIATNKANSALDTYLASRKQTASSDQ